MSFPNPLSSSSSSAAAAAASASYLPSEANPFSFSMPSTGSFFQTASQNPFDPFPQGNTSFQNRVSQPASFDGVDQLVRNLSQPIFLSSNPSTRAPEPAPVIYTQTTVSDHLTRVCKSNNLYAVQLAFWQGARPDKETLSEACRTNNRQIVEEVLKFGARPDEKTFTWACMSKDPYIVDLVIRAGARPDSETLAAACSSALFDIVLKAISSGAPYSLLAHHLARQVPDRRILEAVENLSRRGPLPQETISSNWKAPGIASNRLTLACKMKDLTLIQEVISQGGIPDDETLAAAVATGDETIINKIVSLGAKSTGYDQGHPEGVLTLACKSLKPSIINAVIISGSKPQPSTYQFLREEIENCCYDIDRKHLFDQLESIAKKVLSIDSHPPRSMADFINTKSLNFNILAKNFPNVNELLNSGAKADGESLYLASQASNLDMNEQMLRRLIQAGASPTSLNLTNVVHSLQCLHSLNIYVASSHIRTYIKIGIQPNDNTLGEFFKIISNQIVQVRDRLNAVKNDSFKNGRIDHLRRQSIPGIEKEIREENSALQKCRNKLEQQNIRGRIQSLEGVLAQKKRDLSEFERERQQEIESEQHSLTVITGLVQGIVDDLIKQGAPINSESQTLAAQVGITLKTLR